MALASLLQPSSLSHAHMESSDVPRSVRVLRELLLFEEASAEGTMEQETSVVLRHPCGGMRLRVNSGGSAAAEKHGDYHYGVRVASNEDLRQAHAHIRQVADSYGITGLTAPEFSHGALQFYFREPGGNCWEVECFEDLLRREEAGGGLRLSGVRGPHWKRRIPQAAYPHLSYVTQAFTHGTLVVRDVRAAARFYGEVLGLEVVQAAKEVIYVKHPGESHYIVCLPLSEENHYPDSFRYQLTFADGDLVAQARSQLVELTPALRIKRVDPLTCQHGRASLLIRDPDNNCWELTAAAAPTPPHR